MAAKRIIILTATLAATSDTITLTLATHGVRTIYAVLGSIETGVGANFATLQIAFSGLVITVVSKNAAGAAATTFGDIRLVCIVD
ncbi:hypothetical protein KKH13_04540 [Patescibacteria group bacterium]|nr:hypothetical protein [Patescibacteria group bacterium]